MVRNKRPIRAIASLVLTLSLVSASAVAFSGCTTDPRLAAIDRAVLSTIADSTPHLVGVHTGDIAKALADAGDNTPVAVPVWVPDLGTVDTSVTATSESDEVYTTPSAAAAALAGSGRAAWDEWLKANPDAVHYVETSIPVTISGDKDSDLTVKVDDTAFRTFARPMEDTNVELFVQAAEDLPQWRQAMVYTHSSDFAAEITGIAKVSQSQATVKSVEPASDGLFRVAVVHPDPKAVIAYRAQRAVDSYGTGKIWGEVSRAQFESRLNSITDLPSSIPADLTTEATVKVTAPGDGSYQRSRSLEENLRAQSARYQVQVQQGSYTLPSGLDQALAQAVDQGLAKISARVVKKQAMPGTTRLVAGTSGMSMTIKTGSGSDKHITFFQWGSTKQVASAFIKKGGTLTIRVPVGSYRLVYATGDSWYGPQYSFGPKGSYREFKTSSSSSGPMKVTVQSGHYYTVSIGVATTGSAGGIPSGTADNPYGT